MEYYAKINTDISNVNLDANNIVKLLSCEFDNNFSQNIKVRVMNDNMVIYDISSIYIDRASIDEISKFEENLRIHKLKIATEI